MLDILSTTHVRVLLRLGLAVLLGGLIGLEREFHGKPAGLRTHILVCLGAAMVVVFPEFFPPGSPGESWAQEASGRIMAGVVTGIGFLGAGVIIREGDVVRGLTTAAGIWFTAALGIVLGLGQYFLGLVSTTLCLIVLVVFDRVDHLIRAVIRRMIRMNVEEERVSAVEKRAEQIFKQYGIRVDDRAHRWDGETRTMEMTYSIRTVHRMQSGEVVTALGRLEGVKTVNWE